MAAANPELAAAEERLAEALETAFGRPQAPAGPDGTWTLRMLHWAAAEDSASLQALVAYAQELDRIFMRHGLPGGAQNFFAWATGGMNLEQVAERLGEE
jgi:hypothetical protein